MSEYFNISIAKELDEALEAMELTEQDRGVVALAKLYAKHLDLFINKTGVNGPKFLEVLRELGMTPRARAAILKGKEGNDDNGNSELDELRNKRDSRQHPA